MTIRFSAPYVSGREKEYVGQVISLPVWHGDGDFTARATAWLEDRMGARALLTTSGTHSLELAALLLEIGPGDEVICPAFTFPSTATAIAMRGATPVFVDVDQSTYNVTAELVEAAITPQTRAVFIVHYGGVPADVDEVVELCSDRGLSLVEDNAHGLGATWRGKPLGTFGRLAAQSFHDTKNVTAGEGGALVFGDPTLEPRAEIIREKGTNRAAFLRGQVDKYTWTDHGSSYLPSELQAALLTAQFEAFEDIQTKRHAVWHVYDQGLQTWAEKYGVQTMHVPEGNAHPAHLYYLVLGSLEERTAFIDHLKASDIVAAFHYQSLATSPAGRRLGRTPGPCPVTDRASEQLVRLPLHAGLSVDDADRVVAAVQDFRP